VLAIDLFCGLGGWAEGFLAEGYTVIGFDIEIRPYPGHLVIQDVLTLHGSQFKDAVVIVASPPCQAYSYRAMPWKRAKALPPPSNELFDACFRIQQEACEAAGRYIPMVVENVKGAQPWVGRAKWHYGSFYLWGDVPALMPFAAGRKSQHTPLCETPAGTGKTSWFFGNSKHEGRHYGAIKNDGGSWFAVAHNTTSGHSKNPVSNRLLQPDADSGTKQGGGWWHDPNSMTRRFSSKSNARKAASALIAKIPFPLANHIARVFNASE
jgi:hypothetical protein